MDLSNLHGLREYKIGTPRVPRRKIFAVMSSSRGSFNRNGVVKKVIFGNKVYVDVRDKVKYLVITPAVEVRQVQKKAIAVLSYSEIAIRYNRYGTIEIVKMIVPYNVKLRDVVRKANKVLPVSIDTTIKTGKWNIELRVYGVDGSDLY